MIQLIVEDAGERRGFKVSEGVLTVGAGPEASLQLDAPDIAAVHADLEVHDGRVTLRPRPGVMRPEIGGAPVAGPVEMRHDEPVVIGGARLTVLYPEGSSRRTPAPAGIPSSRPGIKPVVGAARGPAGGATRRARGRRRKNRGALTSLAIFAGAVALIGSFVFFVGPKFMGTTAKEFEPGARMAAARRLLGRGDFTAALAELDAIPSEVLTETLAEQVALVRGEIEGRAAARARDVHNTVGNAWWREHLDKFDKFFLRGTPEPGAVRFFLERLDFFSREWPEHPQLPWVRRMQERYAEVASLAEPETLADLSFEVRFLTEESDPKEWAAALEALDEFARARTGSERVRAVGLREATRAARQEWFEKTLEKARDEYDPADPSATSRSMAWLVRIVAHAGDAEMAAQAAEQLLRFGGEQGFDLGAELKGYRSSKPELFGRLAAQPGIAAYLEANPLD